MTDTGLRWIPTFVYGEETLDLTYPVTRWRPGARTIGSVRKSITGIPGVSLRLERYTLALALRFVEEQWPGVRALLEYGQTGEPIYWYPHDIDENTPELFECYLGSPRVADPIRPARDATVLWMMTIPIVLEIAQGWDLEYFRELGAGGGTGTGTAFDPVAFNSIAFY